jgi:hypothetical protein
MTIYFPKFSNISKQNLTKISLQENSRKSVRTSSKFQKAKYYENILFKNYLTDKNDINQENFMIKFDEKYFNRSEIQHRIFRMIWDSNFSVPLQHQLSIGSVKVLEVGYVFN